MHLEDHIISLASTMLHCDFYIFSVLFCLSSYYSIYEWFLGQILNATRLTFKNMIFNPSKKEYDF